jgi:hypothetical protein
MSRDVPFDIEGECEICGKKGVWLFPHLDICPECDEQIAGRSMELKGWKEETLFFILLAAAFVAGSAFLAGYIIGIG